MKQNVDKSFINGRKGSFTRRIDGVAEPVRIVHENKYYYECVSEVDHSHFLVEKDRVTIDEDVNFNVSVDITITFSLNYAFHAKDQAEAKEIALKMASKRVNVNLNQQNTVENIGINSIDKILPN